MTMSTKAYILVYEGSPLDSSEYRHAALFFELPSGSTRTMHVVGTQGLYEFEESIDIPPAEGSGNPLARMIFVAEFPRAIAMPAIRKAVSATPVKNGRLDREWNCQNWVGDALGELVEKGWLSLAQRGEAIDHMVEVCLEAKDDEPL